jgi:hypothetical protein
MMKVMLSLLPFFLFSLALGVQNSVLWNIKIEGGGEMGGDRVRFDGPLTTYNLFFVGV